MTDLKKCAVSTCDCMIDKSSQASTTILDKRYDICKSCYKKLTHWQETYLKGGTDTIFMFFGSSYYCYNVSNSSYHNLMISGTPLNF